MNLPRATNDTVEPLTTDDLSKLRLSWQSRWRERELATTLEVYPDRSVWLPATREFVLVAPWRHRPNVPVVSEMVAPRNAASLLPAAVERCRSRGDAVFLMIELDETRPAAFYQRLGLDVLEHVITYEMAVSRPPADTGSPLRFVAADPANPAELAALIAIDHAAFPWLWWNSELEFAAYSRTPGVQLFLGLAGNQPVSYLGLTSYPGWGHLDRIAVVPDQQGSGFGWWSLAFAVHHLARRGARRIGLSTQIDNDRSRRLYEGFGFRRAQGNDYRLYGTVLRQPDDGVIATHH